MLLMKVKHVLQGGDNVVPLLTHEEIKGLRFLGLNVLWHEQGVHVMSAVSFETTQGY